MIPVPLLLGWQEDWLLYHKLVFDGPNELIIIPPDVTDVDVEVDIYSDWKEWSQLRQNLKFEAAVRNVGGDPLPGGDKLGATFFLINGWRIVLDHGVNFDGNLYTNEGDSPFILDAGQGLSSSTVSNLIDKIAPSADTLTGVAGEVWDYPEVDVQVDGSMGKAVKKIKRNTGLIPGTL